MDTNQILRRLKSIKAMLKRQQNKPLTMEGASKYTGLSVSCLYKLTSNKELPYYKPNGKKIYFLKSDLDKYILRYRICTDEENKLTAIDINFKMGKIKKQ